MDLQLIAIISATVLFVFTTITTIISIYAIWQLYKFKELYFFMRIRLDRYSAELDRLYKQQS